MNIFLILYLIGIPLSFMFFGFVDATTNGTHVNNREEGGDGIYGFCAIIWPVVVVVLILGNGANWLYNIGFKVGSSTKKPNK